MRRASFDEIWSLHGRQGSTSPELEPLTRRVYQALLAAPIDLAELREGLDRLLTFLASSAGRTDANRVAVDSFFCLGEFEWPDLPETIQEVLGDLAGALHDTVSAPEVAADFESTPQQLLARLRSAK